MTKQELINEAMLKHSEKVINQYKTANGIKEIKDPTDIQFTTDLSEWIRTRDKVGGEYINYLKYLLNTSTFNSEYVEIGKGNLDTITKNTNMSMITPFYLEEVLTAFTNSKSPIVTGIFKVYDDGYPVIIPHDYNEINKINLNCVERYFTQNPYSIDDIKNWDRLHNLGRNITLGIYGKNYDKDIEEKIKLLKEVKNKLFDGYKYIDELETKGDSYFYVISSSRTKPKLLRKVK